MQVFVGIGRDSDEYKVMGLSAYGTNDAIKNYDFSWLLRLTYDYGGGGADYSLNSECLRLNENSRTPPRQEQLYSENFLSELPVPRRLPYMPIDAHYKDIAKSAQAHLEKVALFLLKYLYDKTSSKNLCLAGEVALNVLMNQKLLESGFINNIHVTSVPGDNGLSLGAAILVAKEYGFKIDRYEHPFWGPEYTNEQIEYVQKCHLSE